MTLVPREALAVDAGINGAPCSYTTVQAAINAANAGDTVFVATGSTVHVESFLLNKSLDIVGSDATCGAAAAPPAKAIIQAEPGFSTMITDSGATNVKLQNLTLADGNGWRAGNIDATDADLLLNLRIYDSVISGGLSPTDGGGLKIGADDGFVYIENTTFINNEAFDKGGAIYLSDGIDIVMRGNTLITQSRSGGDGGAVWTSGFLEGLKMYDTATIANGEAGGDGGCTKGDLRMYDQSRIIGCEADGQGGAIYGPRVYLFDDAEVIDGRSDTDGGLISAFDVRLEDRVHLADGLAMGNGGLVYLYPNAVAGQLFSAIGSEILLEGGRAMDGGGVYAGVSGSEVVLSGGVGVYGNQALGFGGGFFLAESTLHATGNVIIGDSGDLTELNRAVAGAGIYAEKQSVVTLGDSSTHWDLDPTLGDEIDLDGGVHVRGNGATHSGGGVELHDSTLVATQMAFQENRAVGSAAGGDGGSIAAFDGSVVELTNTHVGTSRARRQGGGVYVSDSVFTMRRPEDQDNCPLRYEVGRHCSELRGNEAGRPLVPTLGDGGGLFADDGAVAEVITTGVEENGANVEGAQLFVAGGGSLTVVNSLVADVSDLWNSLDGVRAKAQSTLRMEYSTVAGRGAAVTYDAGAAGLFNANIVWSAPSPGAGLTHGSALLGTCNVGLSMGTVTGPFNLSANPILVAGPRGPHRLSPASPAVDNCPAAGLLQDVDLDFIGRNLSGPVDAGAFEAL